MRTTRRLALAAPVLTSLLVALAGSLVAAPAQAVDTGTLSVTLLDEHGDPSPGFVQVSGAGPVSVANSYQSASPSFPLAAGTYAVAGYSPWGGVLCAGTASCDQAVLGAVSPDGSITVTAGETTEVVLQAVAPVRLTGSGKIGGVLRVRFSHAMDLFIAVLGGSAGTLPPQVTWSRDGTPIAGEDDDTYQVRAADAAREVSAEVAWIGQAQAIVANLAGGPVSPRAVGSVTVTKVRTNAYTFLSTARARPGQQVRARVEVTSPGLIVTGRVRVSVGSWTRTVAVRNGTARVVLPGLPPGRHVVKARYLGTEVYLAASAAARTLIVTSP